MTKPRFAIGLQGDKVRIFVIDRLRQVTFAAEAAAAGYTVTKLQQAKEPRAFLLVIPGWGEAPDPESRSRVRLFEPRRNDGP